MNGKRKKKSIWTEKKKQDPAQELRKVWGVKAVVYADNNWPIWNSTQITKDNIGWIKISKKC